MLDVERLLQLSVVLCPLSQHRLVKFVPVVQIVQVHRVAWCESVVGHAACAQNGLARVVIVVITAHRSVMLLGGLRAK